MKAIAALLMSLVFCAACLTGCANNEEALIQKSYTAKSGEITNISVDVRDRQIEVFLSDDNYIHIDYFENSKEYYDISVLDGHTLIMTAQSGKEWNDYIGVTPAVGSRKISLYLPDEIITSLKLSTTNEAISLPALNIDGEIFLSSQGGDIVFDKLNVGKTIRLNAKNGNISGTIIGNYNDFAISCNVKKGKRNLPSLKENGTKILAVTNNNGDTDIAFLDK